jgi:hypothetical protein
VNAAADQQRLMPETTANTWLMTKEHDELLQDETKTLRKEKQERNHPSSRDPHGFVKVWLRKENNNKARPT